MGRSEVQIYFSIFSCLPINSLLAFLRSFILLGGGYIVQERDWRILVTIKSTIRGSAVFISSLTLQIFSKMLA